MKSTTIKLILQNKIRWWTESIEDESLREEIKKNVIITGGAIVSLLLNEKPKDFDVYFRSADVAERVAKYYVDRQREDNKKSDYGDEYLRATEEERFRVVREGDRVKIIIKGIGAIENTEAENTAEDPGAMDSADAAVVQEAAEIMQADKAEDKKLPRFRVLFMSANAITLSDGVQIVLRFTGEPEEIHKNYDFVHCTNYWTSEDNNLVLRQEALQAILQKELVYVGSKYPLCSLIRVRKFVQRGWTITAGQMLKMIFQCKDLDLYDIKVLEEQLTGVDTAYFQMLIEALGKNISSREKDGGKVSDVMNSLYICKLIDRILK